MRYIAASFMLRVCLVSPPPVKVIIVTILSPPERVFARVFLHIRKDRYYYVRQRKVPGSNDAQSFPLTANISIDIPEDAKFVSPTVIRRKVKILFLLEFVEVLSSDILPEKFLRLDLSFFLPNLLFR